MMDSAQREKTVLATDADSRIAIAVINAVNSPGIARMGNLTHDSVHGGFIDGNGLVSVSPYAGIIRKLEALQLPGWNVPCLTERLASVTPYEIPDLLRELTGRKDFIYLVRALRLDQRNFDHIRGVIMRSFADDTVRNAPYGWTLLPIYDHLQTFVRMDVLWNGCIYTLKCFKFADRPGVYVFLFKPEQPGIWFPPQFYTDGTIKVNTDITEVFADLRHNSVWLNNAGDIAKLDWRLFRNCRVQYCWHSGWFQSRNELKAALHFVAEAKNHGITAEVLAYSFYGMRIWPDADRVLDSSSLLNQALAYGLPIPEGLKEKSCFLDLSSDSDFIPEGIPFWTHGGCTLFYGPGSQTVLQALLHSFCGPYNNAFPRKKTALLFPEEAESRTGKLLKKTGVKLPAVNSGSLREKCNVLQGMLYREQIEVLLILCADEFKSGELVSVLEFCEKNHIVSGVFSGSTVTPDDSVMELVSQRYLTAEKAGKVLMKDMESKHIEEISFDENGTMAVTESNEEEMAKLMEGKNAAQY